MPQISFTGLLIVAAVAFLVPLVIGLMPRVRVPSVALEIVAGIAIGPSALGWVRIDPPIEVLALIGLAFILFLAGLEIEFEGLRGRLLGLAVGGFLLSFALAVALSYGLRAVGAVETASFVAIVLSATSLGVVIPCSRTAARARRRSANS